ncbi:hypothetical protein SAMN05444162_4769 [Paenibacillaceae bacterium GAS479]|nr:hypothetical protein SAMN05444162_4769 [Paenibacillaceae bacterium GAS479]
MNDNPKATTSSSSSMQVVLVLFILLVIVTRTFSDKRTGSSCGNDPSANALTKRFYFENFTFTGPIILTFRLGEVIVPSDSYLIDEGERDHVDVVDGVGAESVATIRYDAFPPPPGGQSIGHVQARLVNRNGIGQLSYFQITQQSGVLRATERTYRGAPILTILNV